MSRTNGRVNAVREYLAKVKTARSPAEVRLAVDPKAPINVFCNTLAYMAQRGYVDQLGRGKGKTRFRIGKVAPPVRGPVTKGTRPTSAPAQQKQRPARRNFPAAPGTVTDRPRHLMGASERIAADIAAFQARGGRIQVLGVTRVFHVDDADNDAD